MECSNELIQFAKENLSLNEFDKFMVSMEADANKVSVHKEFLHKLTSQISEFFKSKPTRKKLFEDSIVKSNGDITKVNNIETTNQVVALLKKSKEKDIREDATMLSEYYNELKKRKNLWQKMIVKTKTGSVYEASAADMVYSGVYVLGVKSYIAGASQLLVRIYNPKPFSRFGKLSLLDNIRKETEVMKKGNLDKVANHLLKEKDEVHEAIETGIIIGLGIIVAFITLCFSIRVFTYYFYYTRMQLADYFNQQAQFLNMHKSEVNKNSNLTAVEKKDIIEAQKKWADVFTDISEMIVDDDIKSAKKVKTEINNSNKDLNPSNNIDVPNTGLDFF